MGKKKTGETMNDREKINYLREAGNVKRLHTKTIIGEYTVAHHSWNMLGLLRILNPDASKDLIWAVTFHDCGERIVGDVNYIVKKRLKGILDDLEEKVLIHLGLNEFLSDEESNWLKALDLLELYMFVIDQMNLGNRTLHDIHHNIVNIFEDNKKVFPKKIYEYFFEKSDTYSPVGVDEVSIINAIME
jgi:5'-deoxynucleotidase YfbR-like HD superfamily hydrolase